ncbi:hypothetical protein [Polaribacter sp. IC063]|uniref:hypothetical protein n=1 Tax=Polaribacter sp. IC063 TaxID=57031 RepID=UPI0011BFDF7E|nr:hypothetical protein [Polaribacter sp. IC063]TXD51294.1 hypothetical protein ES043_12785 [Polaribacter sp. IC063]
MNTLPYHHSLFLEITRADFRNALLFRILFVVRGSLVVVGGWWLVVGFTIDDNQKTMFEKR